MHVRDLTATEALTLTLARQLYRERVEKYRNGALDKYDIMRDASQGMEPGPMKQWVEHDVDVTIDALVAKGFMKHEDGHLIPNMRSESFNEQS